MKYEFTKIENNHNRLRDDVILMETCSPIEVGRSVILFGPPRDGGSARMVTTSRVTTVITIDHTTKQFTTESGSTYQVREIEDVESNDTADN